MPMQALFRAAERARVRVQAVRVQAVPVQAVRVKAVRVQAARVQAAVQIYRGVCVKMRNAPASIFFDNYEIYRGVCVKMRNSCASVCVHPCKSSCACASSRANL